MIAASTQSNLGRMFAVDSRSKDQFVAAMWAIDVNVCDRHHFSTAIESSARIHMNLIRFAMMNNRIIHLGQKIDRGQLLPMKIKNCQFAHFFLFFWLGLYKNTKMESCL